MRGRWIGLSGPRRFVADLLHVSSHIPTVPVERRMDLAAVAAIAARCYRPFDAAYADRCLNAARKAWTWATANPKVVFHNPKGITTGDYGDGRCEDELLWASAELFRTTGEAQYEKAFLAGLPEKVERLVDAGSTRGSEACSAALSTSSSVAVV